MAKRKSINSAQGKDGLSFEVDVEAVNRQLEAHRMTSQEARTAILRGFASAMGLIRNEAVKNLSAVQGRDGRINARSLKRFIRRGTYKDLSGAYISITGRSSRAQRSSLYRSGAKDIGFVLKFFENGTRERYTKLKVGHKPRYTGKIRASHFFSQAVTAKQGEAQARLMEFIEKQIISIERKRK